ncbi:hypothetical protein DMT41_24620 [Klebsiella variicola]|nr:hypothetical protein DMT41_24620 [Klebsiella variicola]
MVGGELSRVAADALPGLRTVQIVARLSAEKAGDSPGRGVPPYPGYQTKQNCSPAKRSASRDKRINAG